MTNQYQPQQYWEQRLHQHFDLTGVGHRALGPNYNQHLYKRRLETLTAGLVQLSYTLHGKKILEIGCGTGFYTEFFNTKNITRYLGIDITRISVKKLKKKYPSFDFICADVANFNTTNTENFDIVFIADVLFHIVDDQRFKNALQNVIDCLKPGGLLIVSDVLPRETKQTAAHVRLRSYNDYEQTLRSLHVDIVHIEPIFVILQPPPIYDTPLWWNMYATFWKLVRHFIKLDIIDQTLPVLLEQLDRSFFCPKYGLELPNSKWLFAKKTEE
ncbi:class I SAM-dependent methyltransferase [Chloroflexus sp.]|uniref:class I SAM-dependent methyltransferase n=1 Tax=Chloroflexus sp. TaxID=1904827 RepID=UPI002ACD32BF|nr:class I SAM-dependent methyltransferase [Chloroflexus sp.]